MRSVHNALEWAIGAVEKSTERNVRRSRVNRVADSLDFLSQGSLDFRPDFPERDLGRAAIRKMEIGVSAGRRPPAGRSAAECTGSARPSRARIAALHVAVRTYKRFGFPWYAKYDKEEGGLV